ncbi:TetR/AcrR family transcriptional regulator [Pseudoalteromonas sp. CF6-2]|jgi:AcrR family transcriptional regulator|uniref:TetR/AcrR family transcriptional regulator n=1 Tax=Pseudoalteromonas TaxID=53246 RepID=UPI000782096E|nr:MULTISPECIES: TetR/AcrR family transcriptional regulator [Gammaproteobacteria]UJX24087.1 TetR/AcrR family transcriptional regulator [Pseudoalteromonas sp. CF6-2]|tara:strand:- start:5199 stop:5720 length:522 start_codon:yes stop_codon:yes gene_type:complete
MGNHNKTHQHILNTAWQLFAEHGFNDTSTRQISSACGVAVGTLFKHFESKIAILEACLELRFNDVLERAKETDIHRPPRLKINHYAQYFYQFYCLHHQFYKVLFSERLFSKTFQQRHMELIQTLVFSEQPQFNKVKAAILLDCYFMTLIYGLSAEIPNTKLMLRTLSQKVSIF